MSLDHSCYANLITNSNASTVLVISVFHDGHQTNEMNEL